MRESKIAVFMVKLIYLQRNIPRGVVMGRGAGTTRVRFLFSELMMAAIVVFQPFFLFWERLTVMSAQTRTLFIILSAKDSLSS